MKSLFLPLLSFAVKKAKQSTFVKKLFETPIDLNSLPTMGTFTDLHGNCNNLYAGLRSKVKPGWERALQVKAVDSSIAYAQQTKAAGFRSVQHMLPIIKSIGKQIEESTILEIGCHSGACSYAFGFFGAKKVIGSEFSGYKISSIDSSGVSHSKLQEVNSELQILRNRIAELYKKQLPVSFADDDICNTTLPENSFDIICSWDVLEHLHNTPQAFASMRKLLKNDGVIVHDYNPFFGLNGGHSYCTLDFLWGHARLNHDDFARYISEIRPHEQTTALSFFNQGINRMSISQLQEQMTQAGLEIISLLPFIKEPHVRMLTTDILSQVSANYPQANMLDLVAPRVLVLARKKI